MNTPSARMIEKRESVVWDARLTILQVAIENVGNLGSSQNWRKDLLLWQPYQEVLPCLDS